MTAPETMTEWIRKSDKRLLSLERRPAGTTFWRGAYQTAACYEKGSIVTEAGFLLIAKRYTCNDPVVGGTVDPDWDVLGQRDQVVLDSMPLPTAAADWSVTSVTSWVAGDLAWFSLEVARTGATLTMPDHTNARPGQIIDTTFCTIDSDWWPPSSVHTVYQTGYMSGGASLYPDGTLKYRDGTPGGEIRQNENIQVTVGPYRLAGGTLIDFGDATPLVGGLLDLPFEQAYHNTAKTVVGTSTDESLNTPLTVDFTNPYSFPLRVRASYQPHFYAYGLGTTYMRIYMDGQIPDDAVANTARIQYLGAELSGAGGTTGYGGIWYHNVHCEGIFTVPAKATVTFEVKARGGYATQMPTTNYGSLSVQTLGVAGNGSVGTGAMWARARRTSNQTITRDTGDQHIDFTEGTVSGGFTWDEDGLIIPADGVYVCVLAVAAPYNQSGGGTNGHFTLTANGYYGTWCNTNTPDANHRATFVSVPHPVALSAGHRVYAAINPMPGAGTQTTIESADMYVYRLGDTDAQPQRQFGTHALSVPILAPGGGYYEEVTFPEPFVSTPFVQAQQASLAGGSQWFRVVPYSETTTGFRIYVYNMHQTGTGIPTDNNAPDQKAQTLTVDWKAESK